MGSVSARRPRQLDNGDEITVGSTTVRFEASGAN